MERQTLKDALLSNLKQIEPIDLSFSLNARVVHLSPLRISDDYIYSFDVAQDPNLISIFEENFFNNKLLNVKISCQKITFEFFETESEISVALKLIYPLVDVLAESKLLKLNQKPENIVMCPEFSEKMKTLSSKKLVKLPKDQGFKIHAQKYLNLATQGSDSESDESPKRKIAPVINKPQIEIEEIVFLDKIEKPKQSPDVVEIDCIEKEETVFIG